MGWEAKLKTFEGQNFRDEKKGKSPAVSQKSQKAIPRKEAKDCKVIVKSVHSA